MRIAVVEMPANQYNRINQSFDMKESAREEVVGPVVGSFLSKDVTPLHTSPLILLQLRE
jgi:hypothetical protein